MGVMNEPINFGLRYFPVEPTSGTDDEILVFQGPTTPPLRLVNVAELLDDLVARYPEQRALVSRFQARSLTYNALRNSSREIAGILGSHGVQAGDHVAVLAGNIIEYIELFFAVGSIGAVFVIINPTFTPAEVLEAVHLVAPRAIFVSGKIGYRPNADILRELAATCCEGTLIVEMGASARIQYTTNIIHWEVFRQADILDRPADQPQSPVGAHDALCIQFTSGTTGPRKAAVMTHSNLINNAIFVGDRLRFTSHDVLCCCPPLFHCFGLVCGVLAALTHGSTLVLPSEVFNAAASLDAAQDEGCTVIHAVPTMFQALLDHRTQVIEEDGDAPILRLRTGIIAGSSLSETLLRRLANDLGLTELSYAFGMTELSAVSFMTDPSKISLLDDRSSVGELLPHTATKVVDEEMKSLAPGMRGELLVSGYLVFKEYFGNRAATERSTVTDSKGRRWLRTGDICTLSPEGSCKVVGRAKDLIKRGGENIAPLDVEAVLEQHPAIAAATVVGIPDDRWGEVVVAFVERRRTDESSRTVSFRDIKMWLRRRLAPHKVPEHLIWVGETTGAPTVLPVNTSGKVVKSELRELAVSLRQQGRLE